MSSILRTCSETEELGGGKFRHVQHIKPVAYLRDGTMRRMGFELAASKDLDMPLGADEGMLVKFDPRVAGKSPLWEVRAPDRTKMARFALLGANSVAAQMVSAHEYVYPNALDGADLALIYGGHFVAADFRLRAGHPKLVSWRMDSQAGFDPKALTLGELTIRQPVLLPPAGNMDAASIPLQWAVSEEAGRYRLDCVLPAGDWAGWTLDPTLTLQPDAPAGLDTHLSQANATLNYGVQNIMYVDDIAAPNKRRLLLAFDVTGIPGGATVSSAVLTLRCTGSGGSSQPMNISAHRALTQWYEGAKNGAAPDAGQDGSTWNLRNANGSVAWAGGVGGASGSDWVAGATATTTVTGVGDYTWDVTADVAAWVGGTGNYGWWGLNADVIYKEFAQSDHATAAYRPQLVIVYTLPGGGGNIFQSAIMHSSIYGKTLVR